MTHLLLAVMGQAKYVCAIHRFIQDLLLKAAPELLKGSGALKSDAEFKDTIDAAIASVTTPDAKERDYIRAIVEAAGDEMKPLCGLLKGAAGVVGLGELATRYLDGARFREMLLRRDEEKLERLNAIVQDQAQAVPVKVLMDVAAELDGRAENYDGMDAASKRKASREMKKLIGKVEEMRSAIDANTAEIESRIDEGKKEIVSHVDEVGGKVEAVGKKVDLIQPRKKRKSKYTEAQLETCRAYWNAAQTNAEVKHAINTRITYGAVFGYYSRQLKEIGVKSAGMFRAIIHSAQSRECEDRKHALEAKIEAERKAKKDNPQASPLNTKKPKCGKICGMKKRTMKSILATALSIFAVAASCMASDASADTLGGGGGLSRQSRVEASYAPRSARPDASPEAARAEIRGRVVRVADGDTITILDASNTQHKIRFHGIDAPESHQAFGQKAKQHLSSLVFGKDVAVKVQDTDRYGRTVGKVFVDGRDINLEMLKAGFAWHYKHYDKNPEYAAAEAEARAAKRGLWSDPHPINPYDFRRAGRARSASAPDGGASPPGEPSSSPRIEYRAGNAMPVGSRTPAPVCDKWPDTGYWLSTNSNKRHNRNCENYRKTRGYPCSKSDGTPCGKCGG